MSKGDDCVVKLERVLVSDAGTGISAEVKKTTVAGVDQGGEQIAIQQTEVTIKAPVIRSQPKPVVVARPTEPQYVDHEKRVLVFAIVSSILLFVFQCYWGLIWTVIGIVLAKKAVNAAKRNDILRARDIGSTSCGCTAAGLALGVTGYAIMFGVLLNWYD